MKKILIIASLAFASFAQADDFNKGDKILCNSWEGTIVKLFADNNAKVHFTASYIDGQMKKEDRNNVLEINHCQKQLPEDAVIAKNKIKKQDMIMCNKWRGEVLATYEDDTAKVLFNSSFFDGSEKLDSRINVLEVNHCEKRNDPSTKIVNDIKSGDIILCNSYEGKVQETYTGNIAKVNFYSRYENGNESEIDKTNVLEIKHCKKML